LRHLGSSPIFLARQHVRMFCRVRVRHP